jgi:hypothetical protein
LLLLENELDKELLKHFICIVDTELLKGVDAEYFKAIDIQYADDTVGMPLVHLISI